MTLLHGELALPVGAEVGEVAWGDATGAQEGKGKDAVLSFLYSDVGDFYSKCGETPWQIQGVDKTTTWKVADLPSLDGLQMGKPPVPLAAMDYDRIAAADAAQLRAALAQTKSNKARFIAEPTAGTYAWLEARAAFAFRAQSLPTPTTWGFQLPSATSEAAAPDSATCPSFLLFTVDPPRAGDAGSLKVVRLHARSAKDGVALVLRALGEAQAAGVGKVYGWNLEGRVLGMMGMLGEGLGGETGARKDSLSAVASYAGVGQVEWVANEGYAWC